MSSFLLRLIAAFSAALITFACVGVYAKTSGISPMSATFGAAVALVWCLMIYPRMGRTVLGDVYMTVLTFPIVGATTGTFFIPIQGTYTGLEAALLLPVKSPLPVAPLYVLGGIIVFAAPRLARRSDAAALSAAE